ncbi:MAG: cytochrome c oxidase subunit II [Caldilineaceae bacterium]
MAVPAALLGGCANAPSTLSPRGPAAHQLATLWWVLFTTAAVVFVVVMGLMLYALFRRRSGQHAGGPTGIAGGTVGSRSYFVTVGGGLIPALILVGVMIYTVSVQNALSMPKEPALRVQLIGHQWWWEVRYSDEGVVTANEVHIPAGTPVLFELTSADVIHSFWPPQLQAKMDLLPGQTNTTWLTANQPGVYRAQCAEYCGLQHAHMGLMIVAESEQQYAAWIQTQRQDAPRPADPVLKQGEQVFFGSACVYCHTIRGTIATGKIGPDLTHIATRQTLGAGILPNNIGNLSGWIVNSQTIKPGNQMPPMYLNGNDLNALVAYLQSLK